MLFKLISSVSGMLLGLIVPVSGLTPSVSPTPSVAGVCQQIQQKIADVKMQVATFELQSQMPSNLQIGSQGDVVTQLQNELVLLGFLNQSDVNGNRFGTKTQTALKQLQTANGLTPSGQVDDATRAVLAKLLAANPNFTFTPNLTKDISTALDNVVAVCVTAMATPTPSGSKGPTPSVSGSPSATVSGSPMISPAANASTSPSASTSVNPSHSPTPTAASTIAPTLVPTKTPPPPPTPKPKK